MQREEFLNIQRSIWPKQKTIRTMGPQMNVDMPSLHDIWSFSLMCIYVYIHPPPTPPAPYIDVKGAGVKIYFKIATFIVKRFYHLFS